MRAMWFRAWLGSRKTRRRTRQACLSFTLALVATAWPAPAPAQVIYTIRDLGTLGGSNSVGYGINASGQVTGNSYLSPGDSAQHAFRTTATGRVSDPGTDLGTLGGSDSYGVGINASGQVTGYSSITNNNANHAFRTTPTGR